MNSRIIFYHIPKCSGTSLLSFFLSHFCEDEVIRLEQHCKLSNFSLGRSWFEPLLRAEFIHDPFGVANWKSVLGNGLNVLWLRDPAERLLSHIRMAARLSDEDIGNDNLEQLRLREIAREGIEAFVHSGLLSAHKANFNAMTQFLQLGAKTASALWNTTHLVGAEELQNRALSIAINNLQAMDYIGFVETYDKSLEDLKCLIGLPLAVSHGFMNVDPAKAVPYTDEERALVEPFVHLDRQVYLAALDLHKARMDDTHYAAAFGNPVERFVQDRIGPKVGEIIHANSNAFVRNWYACERNGWGISRWIGPGADATLTFNVEKTRDLYFRFRIIDVREAGNLNAMRITADGKELGYQITGLPNGHMIVEGTIDKAILKQEDRLLWLTIDCGATHPSSGAFDDRSLGLAVAELEIGPRERYCIGAIAELPGPW